MNGPRFCAPKRCKFCSRLFNRRAKVVKVFINNTLNLKGEKGEKVKSYRNGCLLW